ncbi:MAG: MFS transporter [Clostridium celatum]|nr:MFS transporter [Clostridium celatum]
MFNLLLAVIYLAFISLGLPDSLLGSVWPTIYQEFNVPVSYAGAIFMIISAGTIFSSLQSDRLTKSLGTGKVTAFSVLMTAVALFGFSISHSYWMLVLWAIPYGLGAGSVDASLNNYVALHYKSHHMSWLHCMWGVGASLGPYIMSFALLNGQTWNMGYRYISLIQIALTIIIMLSLPLWKKAPITGEMQEIESGNNKNKVLTLKEIFNIPGAKQVMLMFFCYCALEQTTGLWASSYLVLQHGLDLDVAASYGSLFFIGITVGRAISGFITMKLNDKQMIYLGQGIILIGIILMCLPFGHQIALIGLVTIGLGCAPIYPCIIHSTPNNFGADKSQAIIGVQMASAYVGNLLMPPLFGIIANHISVRVFPIYLLLILIVMVVMHIKLNKSVSKDILIN